MNKFAKHYDSFPADALTSYETFGNTKDNITHTSYMQYIHTDGRGAASESESEVLTATGQLNDIRRKQTSKA